MLVLCVLALAWTGVGTLASIGDRSSEFQTCVASRVADLCGPDGVDDGITGRPEKHANRLPIALRLTGWTCDEDAE